MSNGIDSLIAEALKLTPQERLELLADTVQPAPPLHPEWEAEIGRRIAEMDAGGVKPIPAEDVLAEIRALIESGERK